jgi:hypothetical protein
MTPLMLISIFLSLTEVVLGFGVTQTTGNVQIALVSFTILFPVAIATVFFFVLWHKPFVLYAPFEYASAKDADEFIKALSKNAKDKVDEISKIAKELESLRSQLVNDVENLKKDIQEARVLALSGL